MTDSPAAGEMGGPTVADGPSAGSPYDVAVPRPRRGRRRLVRVLLALTGLLAFLSIFTIWVDRQALNTDDWVNTSGQLLENSTIRQAVANYLVDQLYANVNVKHELGNVLPSGVQRLAGPASAGLRQVAGAGADRILQTSTAQSLWETANRDAHEQFLAVLNGGNETVTTSGGDVTLNLGSLVNSLISQVGIGNVNLPADTGQITILHSNQLSTAQTIAKAVRGLAIVLILLTLGTLGLAIYLSRGQRWVTILWGGVTLIVAGFAVIVFRHVVGGIVVDQLVHNPNVKPAANATWSIGTSLMISIATTVIIVGFFFMIAGWLGSPALSARRTREFMAPLLERHTPYVYGGLGLLLGLYFLIAPPQSLRSFLTTLVLGGMAAVGIHQLHRQTATEFPTAGETDPIGRARDRMVEAGRSLGEGARRIRVPESAREILIGRRRGSGEDPGSGAGEASGESAGERLRRTWQGRPREPARPAAAPPGPVLQATDQETRITHLERLADLHDRGVLSAEELATEKARVLGNGAKPAEPPEPDDSAPS